MSGKVLAEVLGRRAHVSALNRAQTDLFWLATEILGFDKLTETFHHPMCDVADTERAMRRAGKGKDTLWLWPREHYKTTVRRAQVVQTLLIDPEATFTWWHAVEEMASESAVAIANMFLKNKELRKLRMEIMPPAASRRFVQSSGFTLPSARMDGTPTLRAWGTGSEATGGHSKYGVLDDIIARGTLEGGAMGAVRKWYKNTVRNVVLASGWLDATGTRWDANDIYQDWLDSPYWNVITRHARETQGKMDYRGRPVLMKEEELRKKESEMALEYAPQMMNDPTPAGETPWDAAKCEHMVTLEDAMSGRGVVVVLVDPAPSKAGTFGGSWNKAKLREGWKEKDYWAVVAVRLRAKGARREVILLDGQQSQDWDSRRGWTAVCAMMRRWSTARVAVEKISSAGALYDRDLRETARAEGIRCMQTDLKMLHKGKNWLFEALAARARCDEFMIASSVPEPFLKVFLQQARGWRPLDGGGNSLRHDDAANAVSFAVDPALDDVRAQVSAESEPYPGVFRKSDPWELESGGRYIRY